MRTPARGSSALCLAAALAAALAVGGREARADELTKLTLRQYQQAKYDSVTPQAYARAAERVKRARPGMRTDQFFDVMGMLIVRDKAGRGIDGTVDGYLQMESNAESARARPDQVLVFGWYEDVARRQRPVRKFVVVFRNKLLAEIRFLDAAALPAVAGAGAR